MPTDQEWLGLILPGQVASAPQSGQEEQDSGEVSRTAFLKHPDTGAAAQVSFSSRVGPRVGQP